MNKRAEPRYHIALSYASEDREYVAEVAAALAELGVRYFFDQEEQVELWGTHLTEKLEEIYLDDSASVLIFISEWYAVKSWPTQERRMAIIRAMEDPESVLSARFDDTQVRGILPDIVSMSAKDTPPEVLAQRIVEKLVLRGVLPSGAAKPVSKVVLPDELTYLLSMLKPSISQFTYQHDRFQGPSLASMHVRQSVTEHAARKPVEELSDDDRLFDESRVLTGLAQPFDDVLGLYDHLVIEGAAGHGKTTLGRHVALELTKALLEPETAPRTAPTAVPLMLPARVLANYIRSMPWEDALLAAAVEEYGNQAVGRMPADLFTQRPADLPWLIIVDALDEIPEEDLCDRLLGVLAGRMALPDNPARFLITSRPLVRGQIAHLAGPLTGFYQLEPFDEEGLRRLAFKWFAREGVQTAFDFLSQVQEAGLGEVLRVPLLASIAADVFEARTDRRLPASRYELYEQCIAQLAKRRDAQRGEVLAALAATANGPELAKWLECNEDLLLEELASAYTTGQTSLRTVLRAALPMPASPAAEGKVVEWLSHTGLMNPAGGRLRFQHQTFAEHLHANARARSLPAFQPEAPEWEELIRGVLLDKADDERVLLHYLHRYNRDEGAVLSWLQQGTRSQREAANRMIVAGAPFLDAHLSAFLETFVKVLTVEGMTRTELTAMAALTRYRPVSEQLVRLLSDDAVEVTVKITIADVLRNTPDGRRECPRHLERMITRPRATDVRRYAAEVLAKFGPDHRDRAAAVLTDLAGDPTTYVDDRLLAAVALVKLGDAHRDAAIDVFRAVIASPAEDPATRTHAAVEIAKIGSDHRAEAAAALLGVACRASEGSRARLSAVKELAKLGAEHRRAAGEVLREWAENPEVSRRDCAFAFAELAGVERTYRHQAAGKLVALALDGTADAPSRVLASAELLKLGSEYRQSAADGYLAVLQDTSAGFASRRSAAEGLIKLGEQFAAQGARGWRKLATEPAARDWSRFSVHFDLAVLDGGYRSEAARALAEFAASPIERGDHRRSAARALANLGANHLSQAIEIFVRQLDDPASSPAERLLAGMVLADLRPGTEDVVAASLFQIAETPTASVELRHSVADAMATLGRARPSRRRLLRELSQDVSVSTLDRAAAAQELMRMGAEDRDDAAQTLIDLLNDPAVAHHGQVYVAQVLGTESPGHRDLVVQLLLQVGTDAKTPHAVRLETADVLALVDEEAQSDAARVCTAVAVDELATLSQRLDAISALARLGTQHRAQAVDLLRRLASGLDGPSADRRMVARRLADLGPEHLAEARDVLVSLAENPAATAANRRQAAVELARLGSSCQEQAVDLLGRLAAELEPLDIEHALTMRVRAQLDPSLRLSALESLHHVATSQRLHLDDRRQAFRALVGLQGGFGGPLIAKLVDLAADPAWDGADRVQLCGRLATLGTDHHGRVSAVLRGLTQDLTASVSTRLTAADWLKRLGDADAAVTVMRAIALDPGVRMVDRRAAANTLGRHCGSDEPAISAFIEIAEAEGTSAFSRRAAAEQMIGMGPRGFAAAERLLGALARDVRCDGWNRYWAAATMVDLGGTARSTAAEVLLELGETSGPGSLVAAFALSESARLDEGRHLAAVQAFMSVRTNAVERLQAAAGLLSLSRHHLEPAVLLVREVAQDRSLRCWERRLAARKLANLGPAHRPAAVETLNDLVDDEDADPWERAEACLLLATLDRHRRDHLASVLRELGGEATPGDQRIRVLELFSDIGPDGRAEADAALWRITTDPQAAVAGRLKACDALLWQHDSHRNDTIRALLMDISEHEDLTEGERRSAAALLVRLRGRCETAGIAVLRRLVNSGTAVDQALSRHELAQANATDWSVADAALRGQWERLDPAERWVLARARAESDGDSRWNAFEPLHRAVSTGTSAANRMKAAIDLARVAGGPRVVEMDHLSPDHVMRRWTRRFPRSMC